MTGTTSAAPAPSAPRKLPSCMRRYDERARTVTWAASASAAIAAATTQKITLIAGGGYSASQMQAQLAVDVDGRAVARPFRREGRLLRLVEGLPLLRIE